MALTWIVLGVIGAVVVAIGVVRFAAAMRPAPHDGDVPSTALERLGWMGLAVTGAVGIGLAVLVVINGAADLFESNVSRWTFWIMLWGGVAAWVAAWRVMSRPAGTAVVDERDRDILARSFSVESMLVLLSLVAWTVVLTEIYGDEGAVPVGYLQLLFWSTFILGAFGRSLGIVLGYRREPLVDA